MGLKGKEVLPNSFVYSNLHFCSCKSLYKVKKKYKIRHLRLLHNDFTSDYAELLKKSGKSTMEIKRLMPCTRNIQICE